MFTKKPMNLNHEVTVKVDDETTEKIKKTVREVSITVIETAIVLGTLKFVSHVAETAFDTHQQKKNKK
jgi:hypothetical protein